jgi:hypothetical protein
VVEGRTPLRLRRKQRPNGKKGGSGAARWFAGSPGSGVGALPDRGQLDKTDSQVPTGSLQQLHGAVAMLMSSSNPDPSLPMEGRSSRPNVSWPALRDALLLPSAVGPTCLVLLRLLAGHAGCGLWSVSKQAARPRVPVRPESIHPAHPDRGRCASLPDGPVGSRRGTPPSADELHGPRRRRLTSRCGSLCQQVNGLV